MYNYIGPTWADRSFDPPGIDPTNFAKVWGYPTQQFIYPSAPPGSIADWVKQKIGNLPTVWVYSDPWGDIPRLTGISHAELVTRPDWFNIWRDANRQVLSKINSLGVPVFLIGTHCDIIDCEFSNIFIGHPSWQYFMAESLDLVSDGHIQIDNQTINHCIAQEIYFRFSYENPEIKYHNSLNDLVISQWMLWEEFYKTGLMYEHHPTSKSYRVFAEYLRPSLDNWLKLIV